MRQQIALQLMCPNSGHVINFGETCLRCEHFECQSFKGRDITVACKFESVNKPWVETQSAEDRRLAHLYGIDTLQYLKALEILHDKVDEYLTAGVNGNVAEIINASSIVQDILKTRQN